MKKILMLSRIVGGFTFIVAALLLWFKVSNWILALVAGVIAVYVFFSVYLSRKEKSCRFK